MTNRPGDTGMAPTPHPADQGAGTPAQDLPAEEGVDAGQASDDLAQSPEEKRNFTDGYAPADDDAETTTVDDLVDRTEE